MKIQIATLLFILLFLSCGNNNEGNTVNYAEGESPEVVIDSLLADTSRTLMAEFPLFFDSTRVLIHPVGFVNVDVDHRSRMDKLSKSYSGDEFNYGLNLGHAKNEITGSLTYLVFEDVDNNVTRPLTDAVLNIFHIEYLRGLAKKTNRHYLLYRLQDKDTNRDGEINYKDVTTFYISKLDGTDFTRLTAEYHQFEAGDSMDWCSRYYYRTLEDVNKDGKFDKKDKYHNYYIDFSVDPYKVVEYNPLKQVLKN